MKLFITNKSYFEETFDSSEHLENSTREPISSNRMHKDLFNQLSNQLTIEHSIPICLFTEYDNGEGLAIFDFITKKGDIYYYEYATTVS